MDLGIAGKTALITGASSGIGTATARALAAEGARVVLTYRTGERRARELADELGADRDLACAVPYDLGDPSSVDAAVRAAENRWGGVDILVANAVRRGPRQPPGTHIEDVPAQQWRQLLRDNLEQTLRTVQLVLPGMRARTWGRVALLSSHRTRDGAPGQEFYAAGKAALHGFARSLAWDAGPDGVFVNLVSPGLTRTVGVLSDLPAEVRERELQRTPSGRLSTPEDVAAAIAFLCAEANGNINGAVIDVSGGR
ncbi:MULTISPECIES: SDR family oxidoreductase [Streptomyces]|uniref:Ketoreductase n=1 Tax=Streptomyces griseus subsp. griseus TaxID=67263 RepID=Q70J64_STRGR|nr:MULTISPECIES: SDR family oxidoreductase [Streptomyces]PVC64145.1 short-chain dehydrogenase [Streptomyces sp. CS065A]CAE17551.1 ketoreductase [Streptomyces griseus subsp. griseus]